MKILDITYNYQNDVTGTTFIDSLLVRKIPNDYLFEKNCFLVQVDSHDYACLLYRMMWETMYLRRKDKSIISWLQNIGRMSIYMSITEALSFIHQSLPPAFKKNLENELVSIESIQNKLRDILIGTNGTEQEEYYKSHFWEIMRFRQFDNPWNFDLSKINKLRELNKSVSLICQVVSSTGEVKDMIKDNPIQSSNFIAHRTQLLFASQKHDDLLRILYYIRKYGLQILSINVESDIYYIMTYLEDHNIYYRSEDDNINMVIKDSYAKIVK